MGSKRIQRNNEYEDGEYSDDFEPYEDAGLDDDSSEEIRVFKSGKGPTLTVMPRIDDDDDDDHDHDDKPITPYARESVADKNRYMNHNRGSSRSGMNKKKVQEIPNYERPSNANVSEKNRQALMVVSRQQHNDTEDEEDMNEEHSEGSMRTRTRRIRRADNQTLKYHNQDNSRKPLRDSQVKNLAKAHMTESYQSMTLRIGGFRKTYGSNTSTNFSKINHGKIQPYTPLPPPMKLGFSKPCGTVSQRLLSAKRMTINDLKNKIKELQIEMAELRKENSALKHVEHRHKMALRKWEGREAELPRLMEQHKEELKNANTHVKKLSQQCRELEIKLKQRDKKINGMEQELQKLRHLCSEAELEERQNLQTELDIVSANLCGAEKRLIQNKRHMEILEKNHQHQIQVEKQKLITANNHAMELQYEIMNLKQALRDKDRVLNYVQMKGSGRKLIRSFHEDERKSSTTHTTKYSVRKHKSDTTTTTTDRSHYDPSSFSKLGSWT